MQIRNNTPQSFTAIHVNTSKMNKTQTALSNRVADILSYSDEYQHAAKNDIDVYFFPGNNEKSVIVRFLDPFSDNFYKNNKVQHVQTTIESGKSKFQAADNIRAKLTKILEGKVKAPLADSEKILAGETDLANIRPEIYKQLDDIVKEADPGIYKEDLADDIVDVKRHFNRDSNF